MRVNSRRGWRALAAAAVLGLAVAGCGEGEQEETGVPPVTPTAAATPGEEETQLGASLSGTAEVDTEGDPDGAGTARISRRGAGQVCFNLTVINVDKPTGAHIHRGGAREAGPIVVSLEPRFAGGAQSDASGCVQADESTLNEIFEQATGFYVNVHTEKFPEGAVRGNLSVQTP